MLTMKKIFLTEPIHEDGVKLLETVGQVILASAKDEETIIREAADCDAILIRSAKITKNIINSIPNLKVVAKHGIGVDNIDVKAATEKGVMVVNAPESNINSVAEHALAMILALSKNLVIMDKKTRNDEFASRNKIICMELKGKTIGLVGLGKIAKLLAKKLKSLDVDIIAFDPYIDGEKAKELGVKLVNNLDELLEKSDFVSLHIPLTEENKKIIGKEKLSKMKKSACLINVARGEIVDEKALYEALKENIIRGAALDVFEQEPPSADNPLFQLENIILSPHNAALTSEALVAMATDSAQGIVECLKGEIPKHLVNTYVLNK
jgi:D-3-phosphoglycerate dehydrogenase